MKTLLQFFSLCRSFWWQRQQWKAWLMLIAVVSLSLSFIQVSVLLTNWNKDFYDALAHFEQAKMPKLIAEYLIYISLIVFLVVTSSWIRKALVFRWRNHLTQQLQTAWLNQHNHYRLQQGSEPDNPDQRIAEDVFLLTDKSVDLFKNFILNLAKLIAFIAILWQLSQVQTLSLGSFSVSISGYLVWIALVYSLFCTSITHLIGRPLQKLNIDRQHREADFRASLLRVRDHSEQIAFYQGEQTEQKRLEQRFAKIEQNWFALIKRELKLEIFSATYLRASQFIPIFATLPLYLAKSMTFGEMMQARSAFGNVQDGFGWFMDYYKRLIEWAAVVQRLYEFQQALQAIPKAETNRHTDFTILLKNLTACTPEAQPLFEPISVELAPQQWVRLNGQSGLGKSSLFRVLAGLSSHYQGQFTLPQSAYFLPQKPYLSEDSLKNLLNYPNAQADDEKLIEVLQQVGLAKLIDQLEEIQAWQNRLSGGEQQRLSLARVLLAKPDVLFLDEATNQLDDQAAFELLQRVKAELPATFCLAITHQQVLTPLFEREINLQKITE